MRSSLTLAGKKKQQPGVDELLSLFKDALHSCGSSQILLGTRLPTWELQLPASLVVKHGPMIDFQSIEFEQNSCTPFPVWPIKIFQAQWSMLTPSYQLNVDEPGHLRAIY